MENASITMNSYNSGSLRLARSARRRNNFVMAEKYSTNIVLYCVVHKDFLCEKDRKYVKVHYVYPGSYDNNLAPVREVCFLNDNWMMGKAELTIPIRLRDTFQYVYLFKDGDEPLHFEHLEHTLRVENSMRQLLRDDLYLLMEEDSMLIFDGFVRKQMKQTFLTKASNFWSELIDEEQQITRKCIEILLPNYEFFTTDMRYVQAGSPSHFLSIIMGIMKMQGTSIKPNISQNIIGKFISKCRENMMSINRHSIGEKILETAQCALICLILAQEFRITTNILPMRVFKYFPPLDSETLYVWTGSLKTSFNKFDNLVESCLKTTLVKFISREVGNGEWIFLLRLFLHLKGEADRLTTSHETELSNRIDDHTRLSIIEGLNAMPQKFNRISEKRFMTILDNLIRQCDRADDEQLTLTLDVTIRCQQLVEDYPTWISLLTMTELTRTYKHIDEIFTSFLNKTMSNDIQNVALYREIGIRLVSINEEYGGFYDNLLTEYQLFPFVKYHRCIKNAFRKEVIDATYDLMEFSPQTASTLLESNSDFLNLLVETLECKRPKKERDLKIFLLDLKFLPYLLNYYMKAKQREDRRVIKALNEFMDLVVETVASIDDGHILVKDMLSINYESIDFISIITEMKHFHYKRYPNKFLEIVRIRHNEAECCKKFFKVSEILLKLSSFVRKQCNWNDRIFTYDDIKIAHFCSASYSWDFSEIILFIEKTFTREFIETVLLGGYCMKSAIFRYMLVANELKNKKLYNQNGVTNVYYCMAKFAVYVVETTVNQYQKFSEELFKGSSIDYKLLESTSLKIDDIENEKTIVRRLLQLEGNDCDSLSVRFDQLKGYLFENELENVAVLLELLVNVYGLKIDFDKSIFLRLVKVNVSLPPQNVHSDIRRLINAILDHSSDLSVLEILVQESDIIVGLTELIQKYEQMEEFCNRHISGCRETFNTNLALLIKVISPIIFQLKDADNVMDIITLWRRCTKLKATHNTVDLSVPFDIVRRQFGSYLGLSDVDEEDMSAKVETLRGIICFGNVTFSYSSTKIRSLIVDEESSLVESVVIEELFKWSKTHKELFLAINSRDGLAITLFVKFVQSVKDLKEAMEELSNAGFSPFKKYDISIMNRKGNRHVTIEGIAEKSLTGALTFPRHEKIKKITRAVQCFIEEWKLKLATKRERYPCLKYFPSEKIFTLGKEMIEFDLSGTITDEMARLAGIFADDKIDCKDLYDGIAYSLRMQEVDVHYNIDTSALAIDDDKSIIENLWNVWKTHMMFIDDGPLGVGFGSIGHFAGYLYQSNMKRNTAYISMITKGLPCLFQESEETMLRKMTILLMKENTDWSIKPNQIQLCSEQTTVEDLQIFLEQAAFFTNELFCVGDVKLLNESCVEIFFDIFRFLLGVGKIGTIKLAIFCSDSSSTCRFCGSDIFLKASSEFALDMSLHVSRQLIVNSVITKRVEIENEVFIERRMSQVVLSGAISTRQHLKNRTRQHLHPDFKDSNYFIIRPNDDTSLVELIEELDEISEYRKEEIFIAYHFDLKSMSIPLADSLLFRLTVVGALVKNDRLWKCENRFYFNFEISEHQIQKYKFAKILPIMDLGTVEVLEYDDNL
ncbi:DgyrCDS14183 [Dimorphilus gyrociliatus]|uniref:DgyrCDS14183 n=1 Tax=Dimorphilus gyrociliatus TaxID=2664684 RepID=A0A7I8WD78_9ANNE|nr:DgyrCDS14183 [Dimorphilus gyrociliatus]